MSLLRYGFQTCGPGVPCLPGYPPVGIYIEVPANRPIALISMTFLFIDGDEKVELVEEGPNYWHPSSSRFTLWPSRAQKVLAGRNHTVALSDIMENIVWYTSANYDDSWPLSMLERLLSGEQWDLVVGKHRRKTAIPGMDERMDEEKPRRRSQVKNRAREWEEGSDREIPQRRSQGKRNPREWDGERDERLPRRIPEQRHIPRQRDQRMDEELPLRRYESNDRAREPGGRQARSVHNRYTRGNDNYLTNFDEFDEEMDERFPMRESTERYNPCERVEERDERLPRRRPKERYNPEEWHEEMNERYLREDPIRSPRPRRRR